MARVTVEELRLRALPPGSEFAAGAGGAGRDVSWPVAMRSRSPAFPPLRGGEFALISLETARALEPPLSLRGIVRSLAEHGASGAGVLGEVPAEARAAADEVALPLVRLPAGTHLGELEQGIARWIVERRAELHTRGQEIHRQLTELAIQGRGVPAILERLATITGHTAALEDQDFALRHIARPDPVGSAPAADVRSGELEAALRPASAALANWVDGVALSASDPPTATFPLGEALARVVAPVVGGHGVLGFLSLVRPVGTLSEIDELAATRGAAACAIELAREQAVTEAVTEAADRLEAELLDALVTGAFPSVTTVTQRAARLGLDAGGPFGLALFHADDVADPSRRPSSGARIRRMRAAIERHLARRGVRGLVGAREGHVVALYPLAGLDADGERAIAEELRAELAAIADAPVTAAFGRPAAGLGDVRLAFQQASGALSMGRLVFGEARTTAYGELGLYRLLLALGDSHELVAFRDEALGALIRYDARTSGEMLRTLDAFLACLGSPTDAAERLHVHRNTLLYRLKRIREIAGIDLDDAETRLALHLALRAHQILGAKERGSFP